MDFGKPPYSHEVPPIGLPTDIPHASLSGNAEPLGPLPDEQTGSEPFSDITAPATRGHAPDLPARPEHGLDDTSKSIAKHSGATAAGNTTELLLSEIATEAHDDSTKRTDKRESSPDESEGVLVKGNESDIPPRLLEPIEIVQATPADAQEIGVLRAHNWEKQYAHLDGVTKDWMDTEMERIAGEDGNRSRTHWIEQSNLPDARNCWLVARTEDGALAGFLEARKHDDGTQELRSLHVSSELRGHSVGQRLIDAAHSEWFDPNTDIFLDVAKVNQAGQRFYSRSPNGYEFTGHEFFYGPVAMLQMVRKPMHTTAGSH